ncbi:MAG: polyprenyl diphosphate synthase [Bacilli bacterium]|nr:polyprenyl diphosphate synthase [Bacilli bacterium]
MTEQLKIPTHVAIIMDGNGRWATSRGLSRSMGHKAGSENLEKLARYIIKQGVKVLSVYAFSTENFKRSDEEVDYLMNLFTTRFKKDAKKYNKENIKVVFSGRDYPLRADVIKTMQEITELTKNNTGGTINICLNYGGQAEITDVVLKIVKDTKSGLIEEKNINEKLINKYLYQDLPPIDFLIRTSGEKRVSNFMLWQLSYAELYFPEIHFPDFNNKAFDDALLVFNRRERRFGGVK